MKKTLIKLLKLFSTYFIYLPQIIYFNFQYLPFKQAIKLPILLYRPKLRKCQGRIIIESPFISFGMIKLGIHCSDMYPNSGIIYKNEGGSLIFKGKCQIGNSSAISILKNAMLIIGDNFISNAQIKIACMQHIEFGTNTLVGWDTIFIDSSFHRLKDKKGKYKQDSGFAPIIVGRDNWFGLRCTIYKGTRTPDYCIFGGNSILNKDYTNNPSHIMMAGNPLQIKDLDVWRDTSDDKIKDNSIQN